MRVVNPIALHGPQGFGALPNGLAGDDLWLMPDIAGPDDRACRAGREHQSAIGGGDLA